MIRPTSRIGQQPDLWFLFMRRFRKCLKLRCLLTMFILLILLTYLRITSHAPSDQIIPSTINSRMIPTDITLRNYSPFNECNFDATESILAYSSSNPDVPNDNRLKPTIERLTKLFQILISYEEKYRQVFDYLKIFRLTDLSQTLHPFADDTAQLQTILCHFQRYISISEDGHMNLTENFILYLKQVSYYLSDGFRTSHVHRNQTANNQISKPVIVLAANARFYDTLQASMRTINQHLKEHTVAIYDLGFHANQLNLVGEDA